MRINNEGLKILKEREGLSLKAYLDTGNVLTIGWGHTKNVTKGQTITLNESELLLKNDLSWAEECVSRLVKVPLHGNQFSALVCFVFNIGETSFKSSTLLKKLNKCDFNGAADEFLRWVRDDGVILEGLTRRRQMERNLFLKG